MNGSEERMWKPSLRIRLSRRRPMIISSGEGKVMGVMGGAGVVLE